VTDTIGCSPDLVESANGWVTPLDDHDQLTKTLLLAIERRAEWNKMGEIGRKKVAQNIFESMADSISVALQFARDSWL